MYYHSQTLPWSVSSEDEQRFKKILTSTLGVFLIVAIVMPFLPSITKQIEHTTELPPPVARLLYEKPPQQVQVIEEPEPFVEPAPVIVPEPETAKPEPVRKTSTPKKPEPVKSKPVAKKAPVKKRAKKRVIKKQPPIDKAAQARKKASSVGLFAMKNSLSDISKNTSTRSLTTRQSLSKNKSSQTTFTENTENTFKNTGSQGIETASLDTAISDTELAGRQQTQVKHKLASKAVSKRKASSSSRTGNRSDIATTFDKNKRILNNIYNRALRKDPSLQGKFVIRLTISPEGKVTDIKLISSELDNVELENKLLSRIKMYKFKAINAAATTQNFSIDFFPG